MHEKNKISTYYIKLYVMGTQSFNLIHGNQDIAPVGVQIQDTEGHIIYSNNALESVYGYSKKELAGKNVNKLHKSHEFAKDAIFNSFPVFACNKNKFHVY